MSTPEQHLKFQQNEFERLDKELEMMRKWGVLETDPGFLNLLRARNEAWAKVGLLQSRTTTLVETITGFSPGEIKLWADAELGWKIEARERPGAPPVYRYVSDEVARKIKLGELSHEEFMELLTPDTYVGE